MGNVKKETPRERVLKAFDFTGMDHIPVDFSGHRSSGLAALSYSELRKKLGLKSVPVRVYDPVQQLAVIDEDVLDLLGIDTIELGRAFCLEKNDWIPWVLPDGSDCLLPAWINPERETNRWVIRSESGRIIAQMPDGAKFFEQTWYPFFEHDADTTDIRSAMKESMWHTVASPPGPLGDGPDGEKLLVSASEKLRKSTDRAIIGLFGGNLLETGQMFFRNDQFLLMLALDPPAVHDFLDRLTEIHMENLERFLLAVGKNIDIILFGDDLGMQSGPQISPEMYREFFKPRHKMMWERAKKLADVKVMLHCCGGVRELLPDLIEAGLDTINPVQITARGMEPAGLKKDFGREIVFWGGGCDTQQILPNGSPGDVYNHVQEMTGILSRDGGFVFQQVHNILPEVPVENILAMFECLKELNS